MGGEGSGAQRATHVGNVEDTLALDIRRLRRLGIVRPGECVIEDVHWSIGGLTTSCVRLRVDISDIERGGNVSIAGEMADGSIRQRIAIEMVPSGFGGWRCYFICPVSAVRCEILYYCDRRFASRDAQRLTYAVQGMNELSRARRKAAMLRHRLRGSGSLPRPRGPKRIGMVERLRHAEFEAHYLFLARIRGIVEASGTHVRPEAGL